MFFPPPSAADSDGLLMVGGQLNTRWLIEAYQRGIFPWPVSHFGTEILAWFCPDPRAVLELDSVYVSRRLARRLRSGEFQVTCDRAFREVIVQCSQPRPEQGEFSTWITDDIVHSYCELHRLGHAHSVEVWHEGQLVGGIYGVAFGAFFAGESMFYRRRDASKVALVRLAWHLAERGYTLFDVQQATAHSARMGATEISRQRYLRRLSEAIARSVSFGDQLELGGRFDAAS